MNAKKPTPDEQNSFCLKRIKGRFDSAQMGKHSALLEDAGDLLSHAYATSSVIAAMVRIVRGSQIARDLDEEILSAMDEDRLLNGIELLSESLSETLCNAADAFEEKLSKGGV